MDPTDQFRKPAVYFRVTEQSQPTILDEIKALYCKKSMYFFQSNLRWRVVQAHWEQLEEMEALCRKEGMLLCRQPDMVRIDQSHICELLHFCILHFNLPI